MNFKEWQSTRIEFEDLSKSELGQGADITGPGLEYYGGYIEKIDGQYLVVVCNQDWSYDSLEDAEMCLWINWARGEVGTEEFNPVTMVTRYWQK